MNYLIKNKNFIFIALLFVALLLIIALIIYPTIANILSINEQIMNERLVLESKLAAGLNIKKTNEMLERVKKDINQLDTAIIGSGQELAFIQMIENEAAKDNLIIKIQSDFQKQPLTKNINRVPLTLEITGNFISTMKFIESAETMPYYYNIESLILNGSENEATIKTKLTGWIYFKNI